VHRALAFAFVLLLLPLLFAVIPNPAAPLADGGEGPALLFFLLSLSLLFVVIPTEVEGPFRFPL
jgi:hypothetical protein